MNAEQILAATHYVESAIRKLYPYAPPEACPTATTYGDQLRHLLWICHAIPVFIREGRTEKAMRWLGFLQGAAWMMNFVAVDEMKTLTEDTDL